MPKKTLSRDFMKPVKPDNHLAQIVGNGLLTRPQITQKIWNYIKLHNLQKISDGRIIKPDRKLKPIFNNKATVSIFNMSNLIRNHFEII